MNVKTVVVNDTARMENDNISVSTVAEREYASMGVIEVYAKNAENATYVLISGKKPDVKNVPHRNTMRLALTM